MFSFQLLPYNVMWMNSVTLWNEKGVLIIGCLHFGGKFTLVEKAELIVGAFKPVCVTKVSNYHWGGGGGGVESTSLV